MMRCSSMDAPVVYIWHKKHTYDGTLSSCIDDYIILQIITDMYGFVLFCIPIKKKRFWFKTQTTENIGFTENIEFVWSYNIAGRYAEQIILWINTSLDMLWLYWLTILEIGILHATLVIQINNLWRVVNFIN